MYLQSDLQSIYDIWLGDQYPDCIKAQAETYISILTDCVLIIGSSDGEKIAEDTFERAMMFVELVDNGESHVWYRVIQLNPLDAIKIYMEDAGFGDSL